MYAEYKAHRPETPDEIKIQMPIVRELAAALGLPVFERVGHEADDLIASGVVCAKRCGKTAVMMTSDKDMLQLVDDDSVFNYNPAKDIFEGIEAIKAKTGVGPEFIMDYLALCGDASDNIPGARGIGPKTASALINQFGHIDDIYARIEEISSAATKTKLIDSKDDVMISRRLVALDMTCYDDADLEMFRVKDPDSEKLNAMFADLEFRTTAAEFGGVSQAPLIVQRSVPTVTVSKAHERDVAKLAAGERVFVYVHEHRVMAGDGKAWFFLDETPHIAAVLGKKGLLKIGYRLKDAMRTIAAEHMVSFCGPYFDVAVAGFLEDTSLKDHSLLSLKRHFLSDPGHVLSPTDALSAIAALYAHCSHRVTEAPYAKVFAELEMPLTDVLFDMEQAGFAVDAEYLAAYLKTLESETVAVHDRIQAVSGAPINLNSSKQLAKLLFEDLQLKHGKKTKTGFSTDEETLSGLAEEHPVVADILQYRKNAKLMSTYLEPFVRRAAESHGLVHPSFDQVSAQTGRLTTVEPNLQNIPTRDESARRIRGGFVSRFSDGVIVSADYSQIELRLLAHASGDDALIHAFTEEHDIHRFTASNLFAKAESEVTDQERDFAKRVNFSVIYGMGPYSLAKELGVPFAQAQTFITGYFAQYPKVRSYIDATKAFLEEHGYVLTFWGRMRRIPDVMSSDRAAKEYALRQGANAPLQGAAADIIKKAMIDIWRECNARGMRAKMILQIHDELLFDVPADEVAALESLVKEKMEHAAVLAVPLIVNIRSGKTWLEATK